jgi:hypothetical protein
MTELPVSSIKELIWAINIPEPDKPFVVGIMPDNDQEKKLELIRDTFFGK